MKFINLPQMKKKRTAFRYRPSTLTTMNAGDLVPMYEPIEIIAGDTFKVRTNVYIEVTTFLRNVFDTLLMDVFWFFCPLRLLWSNFKYFWGENKADPYDSIGTYTMPQIEIPEGGYQVGTIANYMGIPIGRGGRQTTEGVITREGEKINALAFRAYANIVNEFFIADYINSKANTNYDIDATTLGSNGGNYVDDIVLGGKPFIVGKLHDEFTSMLPKPQAGDPVKIPLGNVTANDIPVVFGDKGYSESLPNPGTIEGKNAYVAAINQANTFNQIIVDGINVPQNTSSNLIASGVSEFSTTATINDLRSAIAVQQLLEAEGRHGNKFFEQLVGDYGVYNPDLTLQRPEYLGGSRFSLNINPVVQTSQTNSTPQGTLTSYSVTTWTHKDFTKSFREPGILLCLGCIRYPHTYSQGLPKFFMKKDKLDLFNPHLDGIGEQPIFNKQIYLKGADEDDEVMGYMPYGTEYRTLKRITTGEMSPDAPNTLDSYHFGDNYNDTPTLSTEWLQEDKGNIDRTLTIASTNAMQFQVNIGWNIDAWREVSATGEPGLRRL